ncbi:sugar kinase [Ureibacillus sp. Re31]|uniref:Sugar kinase n=1 Tax=Ureibacillus galli TaxID=2762222 RepID=A0ABR8X839_9BACL|nr:sugar kinase [Ureibacillus galli]MBD8025489.1 sugar kinase [Ureibacillus galli]
MKKIITLGEILLRLSTNVGKRLSQSDQLDLNYGGAETNVSVSLSNFGYNVYLVSKVPDNPLGLAAERHLKTNGVHTEFLLKGGERLGTYYVESGIGARSSQVTYDRKHSSFTQINSGEIQFDDIFKDADLFHITGITPALSPSLVELTLTALQKAKENGVTTSFDFNYRSKLWSHQEAAETIKLFLPYVDICFCGELDAIYILGIEKVSDSFENKDRLTFYYETIQKKYPNIRYFSSTFREVLSASTNTLQGNLFVEGVLYQSKIYQIDHIVDRVGGGDAFVAGMLYGILETTPFKEAVTFATAASVLKHTILGDCNNFSAEEIMTFANQAPGKIVR